MKCPDCKEPLAPKAKRCECGWKFVPLALPRQQSIPYSPPDPPTPEERAHAAKCFLAIRQLADKLKVDYTRKRSEQPLTVAEKIMTCRHEAKSEPFLASRFGAGGYARRCLDCGKVDLVMLPPAGIASLEESAREREALQSGS